MKALITGITGFVGSHMAELLLAKGFTVYGLRRWRSPLDNVAHLMEKIDLVDGDLRVTRSVMELVKAVRPERVYHLAAQSYVPASFNAPADTIETNVCGTLNLLEAIRSAGINPPTHICSSSEVYGQVRPEEVPIKETNQYRPASPYAVSKLAEDMLAQQYYFSFKLHTVRTRAFTHTGPRRGDVFAESSFAKQVAEIERNKRKPVVHVGNLESVRTFLDVRDICEAYYLVLEKGVAGEVYNIGGERTMRVGEMLDYLLSLAKCKIQVQVDPSRLRPSDVTLQVPDVTKFRTQTGWQPKISFEQTMQDLLNYWRERV